MRWTLLVAPNKMLNDAEAYNLGECLSKQLGYVSFEEITGKYNISRHKRNTLLRTSATSETDFTRVLKLAPDIPKKPDELEKLKKDGRDMRTYMIHPWSLGSREEAIFASDYLAKELGHAVICIGSKLRPRWNRVVRRSYHYSGSQPCWEGALAKEREALAALAKLNDRARELIKLHSSA